MKLGELTNQTVSNTLTDSEYKQFGIILLMVIGAVITALVEWFLKRFLLPKTAAEEFLKYYKNLGYVQKYALNRKIRRALDKHSINFPANKITDSLENSFKRLTMEDTMELFKDAQEHKITST